MKIIIIMVLMTIIKEVMVLIIIIIETRIKVLGITTTIINK